MTKLLQNMIREVDVVGRIGGEEFAFILAETNIDEAHNLAERMKNEIANTTILHEEQTIQITASLGICSCPVKNENAQKVVKCE